LALATTVLIPWSLALAYFLSCLSGLLVGKSFSISGGLSGLARRSYLCPSGLACLWVGLGLLGGGSKDSAGRVDLDLKTVDQDLEGTE
jgi:hypothetical protein